MVTIQEYLDKKYPTKEDKEEARIIDGERILIDNEERVEGGRLDLSDYTELEEIIIIPLNNKGTSFTIFKTPLEELILGNNPELKKIVCLGVSLKSLDLSHCPKLAELICDDYLFGREKIKGVEKTSISRFAFNYENCGGGLSCMVYNSKDPKFIWEAFVETYKNIFPEMRLISIKDLKKLVDKVNETTIKDEKFLKRIAPNGKFKEGRDTYYWILDQIANNILVRCLIVQNRLYEGKNEESEEYEWKLERLVKKTEKKYKIIPKDSDDFSYERRKEKVEKVINGDLELLSKLQDLSYLAPKFNFSKNPQLVLKEVNKLKEESDEKLQIEREEIEKALQKSQEWKERQIKEITEQKDQQIDELQKQINQLQSQLANLQVEQQAQIEIPPKK